VRPDIAEHAVGSNIESIYDRHDWVAEKREALQALHLIERIVSPPSDNVVALQERRAAAHG
jgi:hypothetical protein